MAKKKMKFQRPKVCGYLYIKQDAEWLESPAYRDLRPLARCLLEEFLIIYRPSRNGQLSISTKRAAKRLGVAENTVLSAFRELVEHGFLVLENRAIWTERLTREWRLTVMPHNGREPTDDWKLWAPGCPVREVPHGKKSRTQKLRQSASETQAGLPQKLKQQAH